MSKFLILLFLFSINLSFSQYQVVKDNLNCTYGLKDSEGKWALEPEYILIEEIGFGFYKTTTASGKGIFSSDGYPLRNEYDDIKLIGSGFFEVRKNNKIGLYKFKGLRISKMTEIEYDSYLFDGSNHIIFYKHEKGKRFSTYINIEGDIVIPETSGTIGGFKGLNYSLIENYVDYDNNDLRLKVGVINQNGEIIIPIIYDRIRICNDFIITQNDGKIGKLNFKNEVLL